MSITAVQGETAGTAALTTNADQYWIVTAQNEEEPRRTSQQDNREAINLGIAIAGWSFPPPITTQRVDKYIINHDGNGEYNRGQHGGQVYNAFSPAIGFHI